MRPQPVFPLIQHVIAPVVGMSLQNVGEGWVAGEGSAPRLKLGKLVNAEAQFAKISIWPPDTPK